MKLLFMGTSEFAVPILKALHESSHHIVHVFTTAPTQTGRGYNLQKSPIHLVAEQLGIAVSSPSSLKKPEVIDEIKKLNPDAIIVASYGKILPELVLSICKYGCINVHPSDLPRWRGAAPIERTILAGDKITAVCIMQMDEGIDTGDVLLSEKIQVPEKIIASEFRDLLALVGGKLLIKALDNIDEIKPQKQTENGAIYAKKLKKHEGLINWKDSAEHIERMIRAFNLWPGCFFEYKRERIRIISADIDQTNEAAIPGKVLDKHLSISCGKGILKPRILQRPGKKALPIKDFLNGFTINQGTLLKIIEE
jgi:methionyl-tRNA formyltransferase